MAASVSRERTYRLVLGILGGAAGRGASLLAPFIVIPAMLHHLGPVDFGIWMTAVSATTLAAFSDLGIGNGLITKLARAYGANDKAQMRSLVSSAYAALTGMSVLLLVAFGLFMALADTLDLGLAPQSHGIIAATFCAFIVGVPTSLIQKVMYARQRVWQTNAWQFLGSLLSVGLCLGAIHLGAAPWVAVLAYSLAPTLALLASTVAEFRRFPDLTPRPGAISAETAKALISMGSRFLLLSLLTTAALNSDPLIIAYKAGPDAVTPFSIASKLGALLGLIITSANLPLWPAFGEALAKGDQRWIRRHALLSSLGGACAIAVVGAGLTLFGETIIRLWVGRPLPDQTELLGFISALYTATAAASPFIMLLNARGFIRPQLIGWAFMLAICVPLKIWLFNGDNIWVIPCITFIGYLVFILPPPVIVGTKGT
ncbi:MAG: oligosaccharide flippase family protein [Rhizobiales bacterium]|nr:oligosaccharide flippase family protein [Hyphomicrobiales bacterium]